MSLGEEQAKLVAQQTADDVEDMKRSSFPTHINSGSGRASSTKLSSQSTNYDRNFADGCLRRIHLLTTTLHVVLTTREKRSGFSKVVSLRDGNPLLHYCGFTENVRSPDLSSLTSC